MRVFLPQGPISLLIAGLSTHWRSLTLLSLTARLDERRLYRTVRPNNALHRHLTISTQSGSAALWEKSRVAQGRG